MTIVTNAEGTESNGVELKPGDEGYVPKEGEEGYTPPAEPDPDGETLVVAIGAEPSLGSDESNDDAPLEDGTPAPQFVKDLRKKAREDAKRLRDLEAERDEALAAARGTPKEEPAAIVVGEKPTLEACDYDAEKFAAEFEAYTERKRKADDAEKERGAKTKAQQEAYATRLDAYKTGAVSLKVPDFAAAEKTVEAGLTPLQQTIIVKHAANAALVVYALGKDAKRLKELGGITDPVEFGIKVALLEKEIKAVKKSAFKPEKRIEGGGSGTLATGASALEKARAEAEKTGDYSKVARIKKEMKAARK